MTPPPAPNALSLVYHLGRGTFRHTVRQRLFLNVVVFGFGMVGLSIVVGNITFGFTDRVVRSIGLGGISLALTLMAILVSIGLVHEEIEKKTLFVILTKPLRRWNYVVGRYAGLLGCLAVALIGFTLALAVALWMVNGMISSGDLVALFGAYVEAAVLGAFGLTLSTFSTPTLSAGIALGFWMAASTSTALVRLTLNAEGYVHQLAQAIHWLLPNLSALNFREAAAYADPIAVDLVAKSCVAGAAHAVFWLAIACIVLGRREMT
jgi:Cu-processing system permease protein